MSTVSRHEHDLVTQACARLGLEVAGARLVAASSRLVWHIPNEDIALMVSRPGTKKKSAIASEIAAIDAAGTAGVRTPRLVAGPIELPERRYATAFEWVSGHPPHPSDWPAIVAEAARLATAPAGTHIPVLKWPPDLSYSQARAVLGERLTSVFIEQCVIAARAIDSMTRTAPLTLNHGDLQPGNVIVSDDGRPWLIDLEYACRGPREWDPAKLIILSRRFGDPISTCGLLAAWGDLDQKLLTESVAAQEVLLIAWLVRMAVDGTVGAPAEARHRAATLSVPQRKWHHLR